MKLCESGITQGMYSTHRLLITLWVAINTLFSDEKIEADLEGTENSILALFPPPPPKTTKNRDWFQPDNVQALYGVSILMATSACDLIFITSFQKI